MVGVALFFGAGLWWYQDGGDSSTAAVHGGEVSVVLTDHGFEPREITIARGTTVTFSSTRPTQFWPASNLHPSHEIYPEFDPKRPLEPDETWAFTFDKVGVWNMHDHIRSYFTGTIYVVEK